MSEQVPWKDVTNLIRTDHLNKQNKQWQAYLRSKSESEFSRYLLVYNNFSSLCESLYSEYLHHMRFDLISNPERFLQFINTKRKSDG